MSFSSRRITYFDILNSMALFSPPILLFITCLTWLLFNNKPYYSLPLKKTCVCLRVSCIFKRINRITHSLQSLELYHFRPLIKYPVLMSSIKMSLQSTGISLCLHHCTYKLIIACNAKSSSSWVHVVKTTYQVRCNRSKPKKKPKYAFPIRHLDCTFPVRNLHLPVCLKHMVNVLCASRR